MSYQQIWKLIIQSHMRCSYFILSVFQGWCWYCCESSTECIQAGITMETNGCFSPWLSNEQTCRPHGERQKIPCCKCKPENQCLPKYITTLFKSNRHLNYSGNKEALRIHRDQFQTFASHNLRLHPTADLYVHISPVWHFVVDHSICWLIALITAHVCLHKMIIIVFWAWHCTESLFLMIY